MKKFFMTLLATIYTFTVFAPAALAVDEGEVLGESDNNGDVLGADSTGWFTKYWWILLILAIVVIAGIIFFILRRRKSEQA